MTSLNIFAVEGLTDLQSNNNSKPPLQYHDFQQP